MTDKVKKYIFILMVSAFVLAPLTAWAEECMNIDETVFTNKTRPFVCFVHDEHNDNAGIEECDVCHHLYEDGKLLEGETSEEMACSECHGSKDDPKHIELIATYHDRCRSCHLEEKKGPVTCAGCHEKKNKKETK
ncbi:MAG: cytochrome c3 family protein [Desulfobacterium sp.]|nr:cytochrome c3 family protein [Desulfobacterium sp.]